MHNMQAIDKIKLIARAMAEKGIQHYIVINNHMISVNERVFMNEANKANAELPSQSQLKTITPHDRVVILIKILEQFHSVFQNLDHGDKNKIGNMLMAVTERVIWGWKETYPAKAVYKICMSGSSVKDTLAWIHKVKEEDLKIISYDYNMYQIQVKVECKANIIGELMKQNIPSVFASKVEGQ